MFLISRIRAGMDRLSVGQQLFGSFALVLLLCAALGGVALFSLERVDAQAKLLANKWLQGVGELAKTRAAALEVREFEVKHSRAEDRSYHAEYEEKINEASKQVATAIGLYEKLTTSDEERALLAAFTKSWTAYQAAIGKVVALGRDKKTQDATDISDGLASTAADAAIVALEKLTKFNFDGGNQSAQETDAQFAKAKRWVLGLLAATLLLGLLQAYAITRRLTRQLGGEPDTATAVAQAVAEGQLTTRFHLKPNDTQSLMARLQTMQQGLVNVVANVRQNAEGVATASVEIAQGNNDLSARTEQQAAALEETAASMAELGSTVQQNADNARQANQLAVNASTVAQRGGAVVGQVVDTMKGINESSRRIADIISVIDGIAFQTNILALNAAVEAARAGEQGRGFAVVATEVRSLAGRSAAAAKEIKDMISASVERVEHGTALVNQAGLTMTEIVQAIEQVTHIVGAISSASAEQSAGVSQVGEAITQMDRATQQNAALVEESAAAAENLNQQAQELVRAVAVFKLEH
jgi:methyl-accepting chemotaxis protein